MTIGIALGNGKSRKGIDVQHLRSYGIVAGCNRIYQEEEVDILVSTDRQMAAEIEDSGYAKAHEFWTRRPRPDTGSRKLKRPTYGYSSGPAAIAQLCEKGCKDIYFIGFDLGSIDQYVNNLYAGTAWYKTPDMKPTYYGNWVNQLKQVSERWSNNIFYRVIGKESTAFDFERPNILDINMSDFKSRINSL
jgi:hypothetical protein